MPYPWVFQMWMNATLAIYVTLMQVVIILSGHTLVRVTTDTMDPVGHVKVSVIIKPVKLKI